MFDWHAELEMITRRIAEIEEKISLVKQRAHQCSEGKGGLAAMPLLTVLQDRLTHAENYKCIIESRITERSIQRDAVCESEHEQHGIEARSTEMNRHASTSPREVQIQKITIRIQ